jgi:hypothetical protein
MMEFRNQILETLEIVSEAGALAAMARGPQGRLGAATTADRNAAPSIRPQSERRGIWNRSAASPATLKIATRLPASGEIDARAGGELVEARGLAIVLRKAATALFPKDPEIELSVSVALVGGEFVEAHEALQASAAAARKPARWPPPGRGRGSMPAALRPREALYVDRASAATARSGSKCGRGLAADSSIADLLKSPAKRLHRWSTVTPQWSGIAAPLVRSRNDRAARK